MRIRAHGRSAYGHSSFDTDVPEPQQLPAAQAHAAGSRAVRGASPRDRTSGRTGIARFAGEDDPAARYTSASPPSRGFDDVGAHSTADCRAGSDPEAGPAVHCRRAAGMGPARRESASAHLRHLLPLYQFGLRCRRPDAGRLHQGLQEPEQLRRAKRCSFQTWVTTLARNLLVDHFRRTRLDRASDSLDASLGSDEDGPTIGDRLMDSGHLPGKACRWPGAQGNHPGSVETALPRACAKQSSCATSRTWITKRLRRSCASPKGTVKSRISRGRGELAKLLQRIEGQVV